MSPVEEVLAGLRGVAKSGEGWAAYCPAHDDTKGKSLTVSEAEDGRVLAFCHAGCSFHEVLAAIGMEPKDSFPKPVRGQGTKREYHVRDHTGRVTAIHHREDLGKKDKKVFWTTPDGKNGLGGLKTDSLPLWGAEAVSCVPRGTPIVVVEGEKAAFALTYRSVPAVGTVTGAKGTPSKESLSVLAGRPVVLWPDADEEGLKHMRRIGKLLTSLECEVKWYEWPDAPEKGDAAEHPEVRRGNVSALRDALASAPTFLPPHDPATDGAATFAYAEPSYAELLRLRRKTGGITGIRTGIPIIDRSIHGLNKGYSYLIAARPHCGKSLLAGQIALTAAMESNRVLLQTPEMSAVQYLDRFACYMAGVDYFAVQDGRFTDSDEDALNTMANIIGKLSLMVDDYGGQSIERIRQNIERHEPDLVVVDYLQYLEANDNRANRNQQVGQISRDLAKLKSDYNIPVVIAAQLNRAVESRGGDKSEPMLSDLRDSGEIEQDADVVLMLHRPDMHKPEVSARDEEIKILCRKNRMGSLWQANVRFAPGQQWFEDEPPMMVGRTTA